MKDFSCFLRRFFLASLVFSVPVVSTAIHCQEALPPPDAPAVCTWDGSHLTVQYGTQTIFKATLENASALEDFTTTVGEHEGRVDQVLKWVSRTTPLHLTGYIVASGEALPCEAERQEDAPLIVRHSVGLSHSLLNRAVYDRKFDWILSADFPTQITITPGADGAGSRRFDVETSGNDIILRFRPRFYQKHRGLAHFEPWTYGVWNKPVAGWVSWFAYFNKVTEANIKAAADMLAGKLAPYGLEYLQIDDGYQQTPMGVPSTWLEANAKFPSGLPAMCAYIATKGLKPGIWTNVSFQQETFARDNKDLFVLDKKGKPAYGSWVGYVMDGSNPKTLQQLIDPVYRGLNNMGWQYFKVDALRHLRYEGYNSFAGYFDGKKIDRENVYRGVVESIRKDIGRDKFLLGCWGIRPELVGLIDGCRIGDDGFGYGGLAQYNSFNNIVWRNDPDHIQLTPEDAWRSCMVTSLTGSLFMLTDKPEVYNTPMVDPPRRCLPVLFTMPGQVYDVEPSRSSQMARAGTEVSGAGPRTFDADQQPYCNLYLLELNTAFENWMVLGRIGGGKETIRFADLGLDPEREYLIFEFWSRKFLGTFSKEFTAPAIDSTYRCQLFCMREKTPHPQIVATDRHVSCGAYDLKTVEWNGAALSGESVLVRNDPYTLYLTEPQGFHFQRVTCTGAEVLHNTLDGTVRSIRLQTGSNAPVHWSVVYAKD